MLKGFVFDIETNGFYFEANTLWVVHCIDIETKQTVLSLYPFKQDKVACKQALIELVKSYDTPIIAGHNILGFDMLMLRKLLDIDFSVGADTFCGISCRYIDTLYFSQFIDADMQGHSLEDWGIRCGFPKIDYRQELIDRSILPKGSADGAEFSFWDELMGEYCLNDVKVNILVLEQLYAKYCELYKPTGELLSKAFLCGQKAHYLMCCQELTGWKFDVEKGKSLIPEIEAMMLKIEDKVLPLLPKRKPNKGEMKQYTMPANVVNKDGSLSAHMTSFIQKHNGICICNNMYSFYGKEYQIASKATLDVELDMQMKHQDDLKDWLRTLGWQPTLWNTKKEGRSTINTSPKLQADGKVCKNLIALSQDDSLGEIKHCISDIITWLSLENRFGVLRGWLKRERLLIDGRLGGGKSGIANTHRQKHKVIANVPKIGKLFGREYRSLFTSEGGMVIAAGDASGLEGRVQGHYTYPFDNGATARELLEGDMHSKNAKCVFYKDELQHFNIYSKDFDKDDIVFKPFRDKSKNLLYAIMYGAAAPKVETMIGRKGVDGKRVLDDFWANNLATKKVKDLLEIEWQANGKKYIKGIDGRYISTRKKSALLNALFQSCGAIVMDYAGMYLDYWLGGIKWETHNGILVPVYRYKGYLVRRVCYYHDEYNFECEVAIADEVKDMICNAIVKAGQYLKLNIALAGDGKTGKNWSEVH